MNLALKPKPERAQGVAHVEGDITYRSGSKPNFLHVFRHPEQLLFGRLAEGWILTTYAPMRYATCTPCGSRTVAYAVTSRSRGSKSSGSRGTSTGASSSSTTRCASFAGRRAVPRG